MWFRKQSERFLQSIIFTLHRMEDVSRQLCNAGRKWTIYTESFFTSGLRKKKKNSLQLAGMLSCSYWLCWSHILAVFYRSEECSPNMMGSGLNNHQINEIRLGVLPGEPAMTLASKSTYRAHVHDFTCPLRSSYAVMPRDHQSTEKEYPGWEPSKVWKSSGADRQKTCGIVFIAVCRTLYDPNITKSSDKWSESSSGL